MPSTRHRSHYEPSSPKSADAADIGGSKPLYRCWRLRVGHALEKLRESGEFDAVGLSVTPGAARICWGNGGTNEPGARGQGGGGGGRRETFRNGESYVKGSLNKGEFFSRAHGRKNPQ